jgi:beta-galactosidase GanA
VRKDLRRNLEARAARKADEYFFDALCWKVFSAWAGHMKTLRAKFRAVRSQNIYRRRIKAFERWRIALDGERLIWWEIEKHAQIKGRVVNLRYLFKALRQGVKEAKHRRKEDEKVAKKMLEVKGWLGR